MKIKIRRDKSIEKQLGCCYTRHTQYKYNYIPFMFKFNIKRPHILPCLYNCNLKYIYLFVKKIAFIFCTEELKLSSDVTCGYTNMLFYFRKKEKIIEKFLWQAKLNTQFKSLRNTPTWNELQKLQICWETSKLKRGRVACKGRKQMQLGYKCQ